MSLTMQPNDSMRWIKAMDVELQFAERGGGKRRAGACDRGHRVCSAWRSAGSDSSNLIASSRRFATVRQSAAPALGEARWPVRAKKTSYESRRASSSSSGLSGAGQSQAMKSFEDLGFYCIENLPPVMLDSPSIAALGAGRPRRRDRARRSRRRASRRAVCRDRRRHRAPQRATCSSSMPPTAARCAASAKRAGAIRYRATGRCARQSQADRRTADPFARAGERR